MFLKSNLKGFARLAVFAIAIVSFVVPTFAAIQGVLMNEFVGGGWGERHFVDENTGQGVTGTITVSAQTHGTTIQVYNGSWVTVSSGSSTTGSRVRANGAADGTFRMGGDEEIDIEIEVWQ